MFFASFTDLSVGVQTVASVPFVFVLQEIITGGGASSKVHVPPFEETHEGAQVLGRNNNYPFSLHSLLSKQNS